MIIAAACLLLAGCAAVPQESEEKDAFSAVREEIRLEAVQKARPRILPVRSVFPRNEEGSILALWERRMPEPLHPRAWNGCENGQTVALNGDWHFAGESLIHSGAAVMYIGTAPRNGKIVCVNAGHGTAGSYSAYTYCHPDHTPKVTGGTTSAGSLTAVSVSSGTTMADGTPEAEVDLAVALALRDRLLSEGYDVLMIRESSDVQLDNVARTVIANNMADIHIAIHLDGDGLSYDKGCFFMSVPEGIKYLDNVAAVWESSERLGDCLVAGLSENGTPVYGSGRMAQDLTQTAYSSIPSVDIELGNTASDHGPESVNRWAAGLFAGVNRYFGFS